MAVTRIFSTLHSSRSTAGDPWDAAIAAVLAQPELISVAFQPIADLSRGTVAGFEALARFDGAVQASPDIWFKEADRRGCALDLELRTARRALESAAALPPNCFLTINVSPQLLLSPSWNALLAEAGRLESVIVEVTEHAAIDNYHSVRAQVERIRAIGGGFAVDDAGSGFASLNHVLALRPNFVKLDRVFVTGCDGDPAKRALIEMMGSFSGRLDAWIIAEGVESIDELKALSGLRVPLAQGYLLGRPQPAWSGIDPQAAAALGAWRQRRLADRCVGAVTQSATIVRADANAALKAAEADGASFVLVDERMRPLATSGTTGRTTDVMCVKATSDASEVLRRALTRPATTRFMPLVVVDELGHVEGMVQMERLVELVAFDTEMKAAP